MPYIAPPSDSFLQHIPTRNDLPNETEAHLLLLDQLTIIRTFISGQTTDSPLFSHLPNAYIFICEFIGQEYEYYYLSPEFQEGHLFNSGSPLYSLLAKQLTISKENPLTARDKFIFINQFDQFIAQHAEELKPLFLSVTLEQLQKNIQQVLRHLLEILASEIAKIVNAVPTEEAVTNYLATLADVYMQKKKLQLDQSWLPAFFTTPDPDHLRYAQLAKLISTIQSKKILPDSMTRSHEIKLGLSIFIAKKIGGNYRFFSPTNSTLFDENNKMMNSETVKKLVPQQALQCLSAFRSLINSYEERTKLDELAKEHFKEKNLLLHMDIELNKISAAIEEMEKQLGVEKCNWPVTTALGNVGETVCAAPGYALGWVLGPLVSKTEPFHAAKITVGTAMANSARVLFQLNSTGLFKYVMGDMLIDSTISRVLALILQELGKKVGFCAGTAIGFVVDCSYKGVRELCMQVLHPSDQNSIQLCPVDRELVEQLLLLSPEFLLTKEQQQICYTQGLETACVPTKTPFK